MEQEYFIWCYSKMDFVGDPAGGTIHFTNKQDATSFLRERVKMSKNLKESSLKEYEAKKKTGHVWEEDDFKIVKLSWTDYYNYKFDQEDWGPRDGH